MRIADILRNKGSRVATAAPTDPVPQVVARMSEYNVGALPVLDAGRIIGIVSERDVVRRLHEDGADLLGRTAADIMTADVTTCSPRDAAVELAQVMTEGRFRHLPVVENGRMVGIVSIGDLVKARIDALESERAQLQSYIAG